jgi:hypothetical protein
MKHRIPLLLVLACFALTRCAGTSILEPPAEALYVRGPIEQFTDETAEARIIVQDGTEPSGACGIVASVDRRTRYLQRVDSGNLRLISLADLSRGDTVEVYVEGIVLQSCPAQGYASAVVRIADP